MPSAAWAHYLFVWLRSHQSKLATAVRLDLQLPLRKLATAHLDEETTGDDRDRFASVPGRFPEVSAQRVAIGK